MKAIIAMDSSSGTAVPASPVKALDVHRSDADADAAAIGLNGIDASLLGTNLSFAAVFVAPDVAPGDVIQPAASYYIKA